jgi:hypothetical protein
MASHLPLGRVVAALHVLACGAALWPLVSLLRSSGAGVAYG